MSIFADGGVCKLSKKKIRLLETKNINKILVANRGEIAVRVMRTCLEMGIKTVAVYSDADVSAPHVIMADEAYRIGEAPARDSYLRSDVIIETALKHDVQAIHPGYGFLAENAGFSRDVTEAGLIFIGPPASPIEAMGSKTGARRIMMDAGVPVVPGDRSGLATREDALASAESIGYPVLIKAAMGGGGKGMRVVRSAKELPAALDAAKRESLSAFSSDEVYLEKFIEGPRHVEVQVLADSFGNAIHLYERECSIQRRHQKVIEEAPAPALKDLPDVRERMGEAAVAATKACGYVNAGTVEFLFDPSTSDFYFLEMNTRLQVEHPVTEMVTGVDLVREQILVADGQQLTLNQEQVRHRGHSIEVRIYAEDASTGFLPDAGTVTSLVRPDGPWVRVDSGVIAGSEVGVYYDPLIAKLVVWGPNRYAAVRRMHRALSEYHVSGLQTTIPFSKMVMENERYISGEFDTRFIDMEYDGKPAPKPDAELVQAAIAAAALYTDAISEATKGLSHDSQRKDGKPGKSKGWKHAGRIAGMR